MAIERYGPLSLAELKDLIDGLGWFAASAEPESNTYIWYMDEEKQIPVLSLSPSSIMFSSTGNFNNSSAYISVSLNSYNFPKYAFKTNNGLLLSSTTFYASSSWTPWAGIIGKTNNGAVAVALNSGSSGNDVGKISTSAYGESLKGLEILTFRNGFQYPTQRNQTCQITGMPIPTCPSNGTSYIKGALALVVAPWDYYWGEVDINGTRYATNGYLALNDED